MRDRPRGVTVICALQSLAASALFGLFCVAGTFVLDYGQELSAYLPVSPRTLVAIAMLLGYLYLFTSFGMYTGRQWGWWLGVLSYAAIAAVNIYVIVEMANSPAAAEIPLGELQFRYAKLGALAVFAVMILVYLFQEHVREFYRLEHRSPYFDFAAVAGSMTLVSVGIGFSGGLL
ncbi:MAG: hypothetical protein KF708_24185 [Pirellulales bacterium]|nr:hypothetical protein [Pirellulales bacterium]